MIMVKLTSKGPIFFRQKRIGQFNKTFYLIKFRTMKTNAPSEVPTHLLSNAEKWITPIGKFLRRTSLDELPQLLNILGGKMSIVGPRPALWNQYDLISEREKVGIHFLKPGLTGWAQVNGRDTLPIPMKVRFDKYYLDNQSIILDLKIIFMTFLKIFKDKDVIEGVN
jgi:O-antigen biosynthesis protein WbqP